MRDFPNFARLKGRRWSQARNLKSGPTWDHKPPKHEWKRRLTLDWDWFGQRQQKINNNEAVPFEMGMRLAEWKKFCFDIKRKALADCVTGLGREELNFHLIAAFIPRALHFNQWNSFQALREKCAWGGTLTNRKVCRWRHRRSESHVFYAIPQKSIAPWYKR